MDYITIILTESALEMLPDELLNNSKSKINTSTFLDKSYHSHLMDGLDNVDKRGRPDIAHMSSMAITSTPLYLEKKIKFYIHTISDYVLDIELGVRLPKSYHRFIGLFEKLFLNYSKNDNDNPLIKIQKSSFNNLIDSIDPDHVVGLSKHGNILTSNYVSDKIINLSASNNSATKLANSSLSENIEPLSRKNKST